LFNEWKEKVLEGTYPFELIKYFGLARIKQVQREHKAIVFTLEFDCNRRTFFPSQPAPVVVASRAPDNHARTPNAASRTTEYYEDFNRKCDQKLVQNSLAFVVIHRYKTFGPTKQKQIPSFSWEQVQQDAFQHPSLMLNSSLFNTVDWQALQQQNTVKQLAPVPTIVALSRLSGQCAAAHQHETAALCGTWRHGAHENGPRWAESTASSAFPY
jgi:hypothetical protein